MWPPRWFWNPSRWKLSKYQRSESVASSSHNGLSTLLLGSSNYCMQCLASPTREELDTAHGQHVWLDIGIPSVRNLLRIAPSRRIFWCILAASTIPLHLLWNSAGFSTLSSQHYSVFVASPHLINIGGLNWSTPVPAIDHEVYENPNYTMQNFRDFSGWENLDNDACIQAYAQNYVSESYSSHSLLKSRTPDPKPGCASMHSG